MRLDGYERYLELTEGFSSGQIEAKDFERPYLRLFKSDSRIFPPGIYEVLNRLSSDVDMFTPDAAFRSHGELDHDQLLECAQKAHAALEALIEIPSKTC